MRVNSREFAYTDDTSAYLVAGRRLTGPFSDNGFDEFCGLLDQLARELDQPLVLLPEGNFGGSGVAISEAGLLSCALGLVVSRTDTKHIGSVTHQDMIAAVARAEALPWDKLGELISSSEKDGPRRLDDGMALYATASGPLAGVMVGYGVPVDLRRVVDEDDEDEDDWDDEDDLFFDETTGVASVVPGLRLIQGNLMDQTPQPDAVYGVEVARALYDQPKPIALDISDAAHADRVDKLGELSAQSAYHLIAHYD